MVNVNDKVKWSLQIDVPIIPRVDATMEFVNNRLFIFGGRGKKASRSFSEGIFDPLTGHWKWLVPGPQNKYPPHMPSLGICLGSQLIFGNSKILLAAGEDEKSTVKLQGRIFIYSIEENTFTPFTATGFLPSTLKCYDMSLYFHDRFFGDEDAEQSKDEQRCCVLISGWDNVTTMPRIPQLLALNISSSPGKSEVVHINAFEEVNDRLKENNLDMIAVNAVTGKRVVALCSESEGPTVTWDKLIEIAV
ncbi:hypothetical protein H0H93_014558 [Arthromyces matolae]|nr:hypothetical protein H0H93_014558 [Arthromyces matolae]